MKSAKNEIIEGVLDSIKSEKTPTGKRKEIYENPPQAGINKSNGGAASNNSGSNGSAANNGDNGTSNNVGGTVNNCSGASNNSNNVGVINACGRNKRMNIMVIGAALGLIFCLLTLTSYKGDLPGEVVGIISTVSGIFGACLKDAYSFEFGSSRGSKEKDEKISSTILERMKYN
jgi:hypothetical protein